MSTTEQRREPFRVNFPEKAMAAFCRASSTGSMRTQLERPIAGARDTSIYLRSVTAANIVQFKVAR